MSALYRVIAIGLIIFALIFSIVAAATNDWIVVSTVHVGLFWVCSGGHCTNTLDAFSSNEGCRSKDQAAQAFIVMAIIVLFPLLVFVVIRRFFASSSIGSPIVRNIPAIVDVVLAAFVMLSLIISWACVAAIHDQCVCKGNTSNCGLNFSWAFALIASVAVMVVAVLLFLSKEESNAVHVVHETHTTHQVVHVHNSHPA